MVDRFNNLTWARSLPLLCRTCADAQVLDRQETLLSMEDVVSPMELVRSDEIAQLMREVDGEFFRFFVFFDFLALFIDLLTDKVQPLSSVGTKERNERHCADDRPPGEAGRGGGRGGGQDEWDKTTAGRLCGQTGIQHVVSIKWAERAEKKFRQTTQGHRRHRPRVQCDGCVLLPERRRHHHHPPGEHAAARRTSNGR